MYFKFGHRRIVGAVAFVRGTHISCGTIPICHSTHLSTYRSGPNDVTATIAEWSKQPGQQVQKGEVIGSAETTKSVFDLEASAAGTFWPLAAPGAEAAIGAIVGAIGGEQSSQAEAMAWLAGQSHGQAAAASNLAVGAATSGVAQSGRPTTLKAELLAQRSGINLAQVLPQVKRLRRPMFKPTSLPAAPFDCHSTKCDELAPLSICGPGRRPLPRPIARSVFSSSGAGTAPCRSSTPWPGCPGDAPSPFLTTTPPCTASR